jgi:hypothetical protein
MGREVKLTQINSKYLKLTQNISKYLKIGGGFDPPIGALAFAEAADFAGKRAQRGRRNQSEDSTVVITMADKGGWKRPESNQGNGCQGNKPEDDTL